MDKNAVILVTGSSGMVGGAVYDRLVKGGWTSLVTLESAKTNLRDRKQVDDFFKSVKPEYVFLSAAKVGGIHANNTFPAEFIYDNLMIAANTIDASYRSGVKRLLFFGSSCIYPKQAAQPMKENVLLTGELEPTNKPYALAKIAGMGMCEAYNRQYKTDFRSVMPTNVYGPRDNYHLKNSHVMAALIYKFHLAKTENTPSVTLWGSGKAQREFIYADDLADAALFIMQLPEEKIKNKDRSNEHINVGCGEDISISDLALLIKSVVGYEGSISWDTSMPDGTLRKLLDVSRLHDLGWRHKTNLSEGIYNAYQWFLQNEKLLRKK